MMYRKQIIKYTGVTLVNNGLTPYITPELAFLHLLYQARVLTIGRLRSRYLTQLLDKCLHLTFGVNTWKVSIDIFWHRNRKRLKNYPLEDESFIMDIFLHVTEASSYEHQAAIPSIRKFEDLSLSAQALFSRLQSTFSLLFSIFSKT